MNVKYRVTLDTSERVQLVTMVLGGKGVTSLTGLVQSAISIAKQAQQAAGPSTSYSAIGKGSTAQAEAKGTFTGVGGTFPVVTGGTVNFAVAVNGTSYNLSFVSTAGDTAIALLTPLMAPFTVSIAETVWLPADLSVAPKVPTPLVSVELPGTTAKPSVLLKLTVPL